MKQYSFVGLAILLTGAASLRGQSTTVDLTKQGRIEKGAQLAAHCTVGQLYIYTPAPEGANLYLCSAQDTWSAIGGAALGGDAGGSPWNATVLGIQGRPVDSAAPANRDVLRWDAATGKWLATAESAYTAGAGVTIAGSAIAVEDAVVPVYYAGAGAPTITCVSGRDFYVDTTAGTLYFCKGGVAGWQEVSLPGHVHAAGDIASGTLTPGRLPSSVVLNGQTNNFGAGQKQSVGHDASAAGLRLRPAPGDPASPQDGDVWYNSTTGKFRRWQNGVAMDWDVAAAASAVLSDRANTYTSGMRQSVSHDAANAGLRILPAAGDPASAQDGDVWYNLTTGKFRRRQNGANSDWDIAGGATAVLFDRANTYTSGMRQSVSHDAANAGLRIVPATGDPASAQDGDVWYNLTTGKFRRRQNGANSDWDIAGGATAVLSDRANTYTGGMRQSVSHDTANAGLRILPAAGDPASAQDGDIWYNLTTGKFRRRQNGANFDWDIAGAASAALLDQANTFAGGMRQSVSHDAANAGLRILPAAGDPASAQDGDVWYNLTTGKFRRRQNSANSDWDIAGGASAVLLDHANTYTSGMRQSVSHDAANAGLRIVPATGDPASAQDGDVWYNSTTGKFRRRQNGANSDWDIAGAASAALLDQANTFAGGMRQSVSHDAANAGLRIVPATGDPAGAQDGDLWYNLTTGKFRRRQNGATSDWDNGGSGKSFNPHDTSSFWMVEDFTFRGPFNGQNYGLYGWYNEPIAAGCGTGSYNVGTANHPAMARLLTATSVNVGCSAQLDGGNYATLVSSVAASTWEARWTIVPDSAYLTSNFILRTGLGNTTHDPSTQNSFQVRIDPAASPNIQYDLITAGASTATLDSTVAYDATATSYTFRLRGDGSKLYFSVSKNGAAFSAERTLCPSGCDMTAALPTFGASPFLSLVHGPTSDSSLKRVYLDRFSFDMSGLSR